jgi:hypothetical protein
MMRWVRRLFLLGMLASAGYGALRIVRQRQSTPAASPQWPPLNAETETDVPAAAVVAVAAVASGATADSARWVGPVDGRCPDGYPVKANDNSGIFHVPGGRFYDRTVAERCYANADDALADGYRPAKA